ncbi:MAG: AAA family ATPase [Candidatus Methanospirareceae archaeon]
MLTNIWLKNFRVFEEAGFELKPLTILVGENGVGKSTVLYALCFIAQSLTEVNYNGELINLFSFDETARKEEKSFEIGVEIEEEGRKMKLYEKFEKDGVKNVIISMDGKSLLKTEKEWLIKEIIENEMMIKALFCY